MEDRVETRNGEDPNDEKTLLTISAMFFRATFTNEFSTV